MDIVNYIRNAKDGYTRKTGRNPTTIYLGHEEFKELKNSDDLKLNAHYYDEETKLNGGRFIFGLKVIEVNQSSHFNIV